MKTNILKDRLNYFIEPHPRFKGTEENIFTPKKGLVIKFWFEGGFEIEGRHDKLEINFNDPKLLILALKTTKMNERIIRIPFERLIAFELLPKENIDSNLEDLLRLGKERKN